MASTGIWRRSAVAHARLDVDAAAVFQGFGHLPQLLSGALLTSWARRTSIRSASCSSCASTSALRRAYVDVVEEEHRGECQAEDAGCAELQDIEPRHALLGSDKATFRNDQPTSRAMTSTAPASTSTGEIASDASNMACFSTSPTTTKPVAAASERQHGCTNKRVLHTGDEDALLGDAVSDGAVRHGYRLGPIRQERRRSDVACISVVRRPAAYTNGAVHVGQQQGIECALIDFGRKMLSSVSAAGYSDADRMHSSESSPALASQSNCRSCPSLLTRLL